MDHGLFELIPYWAAIVVLIGGLRVLPFVVLGVAGAVMGFVAVQVWAVFGPVLALIGRVIGLALVVAARIAILGTAGWILIRAGTAAFT
jgi:hypothetical protein